MRMSHATSALNHEEALGGKGKPGLPLGEEEDVGYICTCVCTSSPHRYSTSAFFPDDSEWRGKWRGTTGKETAHEVNASGLRVFRRYSLQTKRPLVPLRIHVLSHWKHSFSVNLIFRSLYALPIPTLRLSPNGRTAHISCSA